MVSKYINFFFGSVLFKTTSPSKESQVKQEVTEVKQPKQQNINSW